jgi:nucleotide-binding universal stress UspA family protein
VLEAAGASDLVVAAARSGSGRRPGLGHTAAWIVRGARCPVLLVGPATGALRPAPRLLVAVDFSEASAAALREGRRLAAALGGTVEAVLAAEPGAEPPLRRLARFVDPS